MSSKIMEVKEAKNFAKKVEIEILELLKDYQEKSGCYITDIHAFTNYNGILKVGLDVAVNKYLKD